MNKILIVGPTWVGDMVMAQSLFKVLKQTHPDASISVLAPAWSMQLLERMPEVAETIHMPVKSGQFRLRTRRQLGHSLRTKNFTHAIVLPGSLKSALIPWFANIPIRSGYVGEQRWGLLNDIRKLNKSLMPLNVQRFVALGLPKPVHQPTAPPVKMADIPYPKLAVQPAMARKTAEQFELNTDNVIALCPGAEYGPAKQWPAEHFAEVANQQLQQGRQVWLFGGENDRAIAAQINQLCQQRCADLTGRTTLAQAVDLLSFAKHAVTNDSGLMHVAAAVGCHVVVLYGSSSDAFTPPLSERSDCLTLRLGCSPCFKRECPLGHLDCLKKLLPEMVISVLQKNVR